MLGGVRQGCVLWPVFLNLYSEEALRIIKTFLMEQNIPALGTQMIQHLLQKERKSNRDCWKL